MKEKTLKEEWAEFSSMKIHSFTITPLLKKQLEAEALKQDRSQCWIIREALKRYIK